MKHVHKILNKINTHLITWGEPFDCNGEDVIVCVSGNPGVPDFYIEFAKELHQDTKLPVIVIGQAGHDNTVPDSNNLTQNTAELYDLRAQVQHKLDLIDNHIDKKSRIHLVGHSIGSWMILELFNGDNQLLQRISSINLLFPTIQYMAKSKNGQFLNNFWRKFHYLVMLLVTLVNLLPDFILLFFINLYIRYNSLPAHYKNRIKTFLSTQVVEKVLYLAYDEMDRVTELNHDSISKVKHLTNVIYSSRDGWAPLSYMEDLKQYRPSIQMKEVDINHAFVLKSSERVAQFVAEFIQTRRKT